MDGKHFPYHQVSKSLITDFQLINSVSGPLNVISAVIFDSISDNGFLGSGINCHRSFSINNNYTMCLHWWNPSD